MISKKIMLPGLAVGAILLAGCTINVNGPQVPVDTGGTNIGTGTNSTIRNSSDDFTSTGLKLRGDGTVDDNDRNRGGDDRDWGGGGDDGGGDDNSGRGS